MGFRSTIPLTFCLLALCAARGENSDAPASLPAEANPLDPGRILTLPLDANRPYSIGISPNLPTTIILPDVPETFQGVGFTNQRNIAAPVYLDYAEGASFFSVRALFPGATADLNVILNKKAYAFKFFHTNDRPVRTLTLFEPSHKNTSGRNVAGNITTQRLIEIVEQTKRFFVIQENYPDLQHNIEHFLPGTVQQYLGYKVILDQGFRFDNDDTLVFRVVFSNETPEKINYRVDRLALRVGLNVYQASISDASGVIPPITPARIQWLKEDGTTLSLTGPDKVTRAVETPTLEIWKPGKYTLTARHGKKGEKFEFVIHDPAGLTIEQAKPVVLKGRYVTSLHVLQPRSGQSWAYVAFTGNPDGSRANISIKNDFALLVDRANPPAP